MGKVAQSLFLMLQTPKLFYLNYLDYFCNNIVLYIFNTSIIYEKILKWTKKCWYFNPIHTKITIYPTRPT